MARALLVIMDNKISKERVVGSASISDDIPTFQSLDSALIREGLAAIKGWSGEGLARLPEAELGSMRGFLIQYLRPQTSLNLNGTPSDTIAALKRLGVEEVSLSKVGLDKYTALSREALLSYLPKEDVDSQRQLKRFVAPTSAADKKARAEAPYVHSLSINADGRPEYNAGFLMQNPVLINGKPATILQVDFCSPLERGSPQLEVGKLEIERLIQNGTEQAAKHGMAPPSYAFVEASGGMIQRYSDLGFVQLAQPGTKNDGDPYVMMALPLSGPANKALFAPETGKALWLGHVETWLDTNWRDQSGPNWRSNPRAMAAYQEMAQGSPRGRVWNQVLPE